MLRLETPVDLGPLVASFENSTRIQGEFPLRSGAAGSVAFRSGTFEMEGSLLVDGLLTIAAATTVRLDDELRLATGATLDNRGTRDGQNRSNLRVRSFVNPGATLLGPPPDVVPISSPLGLRFAPPNDTGSRPHLTRSDSPSPPFPTLLLSWDPVPNRRPNLEFSQDLVTWSPLALDEAALEQGVLRLAIPPPTAGDVLPDKTLFFRHRETEW